MEKDRTVVTMKAWQFNEFGGPERLELAPEAPSPEMDDDEILIELACAGVNPVDWKLREGYLKDALPHRFPIIPGWDGAGEVADVGEVVLDGFAFGDRVFAYCRKSVVHDGTYSEAIAVPASSVAKIPDNLGFEEAATIPLAGLTAWQALFDYAGLSGWHKALVHAGAGGVGSLAVQLAKWAGAAVYTTASSGNHDYVRQLGADRAIDYRNEDFVAALRKAEPDGVDIVFDLVGGETQARSYEVLKPGGVLVSIVDVPDPQQAQRHQVNAGYWFVQPDGEQLSDLADLLETGELRAPAVEVLPFDEAVTAQRRSQDGHVRGKLVLKIK